MKKDYITRQEHISYAAKKIYGNIITLALIVSFEHLGMTDLQMVLSILGTLFTIALAEIYVGYTAHMMNKKSKPSHAEFYAIVKEELSVMLASDIPIFVFVLEVTGIISIGEAFFLAKTISIFMLFLFGSLTAKMLKKSFPQRILFGLVSALLGFFIVVLKVLIK